MWDYEYSTNSKSSSKSSYQEDDDAYELDNLEEATAFHDSKLEAGLEGMPRSDISSTLSYLDHLHISVFPEITIDAIPVKPDNLVNHHHNYHNGEPSVDAASRALVIATNAKNANKNQS